MRQPTVKELFDRMENKESNCEKGELVKEEKFESYSEIENVIENNDERIEDLNGIVEVRYGNETYRVWKVEFIRPFIKMFIKEKCSDSIIVRELNKIDLTLFDNKLDDIITIEIQKTPISGNENKTFLHTHFENVIRKQLEDNIENYGKCWFFMDSEYLRYLQSGNVGKGTSINMTWIIDLMREKELKVFGIKYDGAVKELTTKDFDFLKDVSQTCIRGYDNDERILNRNKLKIFHNVINGYKFTQEEITQFETDFDNIYSKDEYKRESDKYFRNSINERCKLYGDIWFSVSCLETINCSLSCNMNKNIRIDYGVMLGLFHQNDFYGGNKNARVQFIDKFDIAQYFPGYLRNKEMWDYCKNKQRVFTFNELKGIVTGTFNYELIKKQSTMADY